MQNYKIDEDMLVKENDQSKIIIVVSVRHASSFDVPICETFLWNVGAIKSRCFYEIRQSLKRPCNHIEMSGNTQLLGGDDIILGKSRPPLEKLSHLKVQYCLKGGQFKNNIALKVAQSKIWFQNCTSLNNFKSPSLPSGQCGRWGLKPSV